jgi:hypothetical protein
MNDIRQTFINSENAFRKLLPTKVNDWRKVLPLNVLVKAQKIEEFENFKSNWESFLEQLDKIWNRLNAYAKHHIDDEKTKNSVQGFLGQANDKRKHDQLLVYLDKARNSAHHTLWRHIRKSEKGELITDAKGVSINVNSGQLQIKSLNGGTVSEIVILENYVVLLSAVDIVEQKAKKTIYLPEKHLGEVLYPFDRVLPQMIGKMGLIFYESLILNIEKRIKKSKNHPQ